MPSVLLVDAKNAVTSEVEETLARHFRLEHKSAGELTDALDFDAVLVPESSVQSVPALDPARLGPRLVVIAERPSLANVVGAIRARASDIVNGHDPSSVVEAVKSSIDTAVLEAELARLRDAVPTPESVPELLGESKAMQRLRARIERIANSEVTTLISGPSGSGKDLVARALHRTGPRSAKPFVAVACGAVPRHLMESEFFGHTRGAFTGAAQDRAGLLARASGGTLFLDEIGELPLELQAKLLRALQERKIRPLGQTTEVPFDARIIAATSRDLEQAVRAGRFREDLYFRLAVMTIRTPPLSARERDVLILAQHFIRRASQPTHPRQGMTPAAAQALLRHSWPGNVRELENTILAALAQTHTDHVTELDLPDHLRREPASASPAADLASLDDVERAHILRTLRAADGNRALASRLLRLDRKTLHRKLKRYSRETESGGSHAD
jgi:two-component system response regulator HydG